MSVSVLIAAVLLIMAIGYQMGRKRALNSVGGLSSMRNLHSLPSYYGSYVLLWAALPSALILLVWGIIQDSVLTQIMQSHLPAEMLSLSPDRLGLLISSIKSYAITGFAASEVTPQIQAAADDFNRLSSTAAVAQAVLVLIVATIAAGFAWRAINPKMRARNRVEKIVRGLLILSSLIAILTTVGIIFSVLFESIRFFQRIPFLILCLVCNGARKRRFEQIKWHLMVCLALFHCLLEQYSLR